jgi:hypothetical protein
VVALKLFELGSSGRQRAMTLAGELRRSYGCEDGRIAKILFQTEDIEDGPL